MNTVIIDDELSNRTLLANMLKKHCPEVKLAGDADSAETGYKLIKAVKPDLVFLDIKMPVKTGFDMLKLFDKIDFSVIFVSGFDEYAIKAFEFNAIDYILKPIDHTKLVHAVEKARIRRQQDLSNVIYFVRSIEEKTNYIKKLTFHDKDKVQVVDIENIVYIKSDEGYSEIVDISNQRYISAKTLGDYEDLLRPIKNFIRVNKQYLINTNHLNSYSKGTDCVLSMKPDNLEIEVSRRKKTEVIAALKS
ncbi:MAG TPA: LytTR family DNA-binding domain-containing protein [Flavobacteriales bacterium]|nr:LytTR family DNA-binding domain-containing protein [Flavobacteriales bacterium]